MSNRGPNSQHKRPHANRGVDVTQTLCMNRMQTNQESNTLTKRRGEKHSLPVGLFSHLKELCVGVNRAITSLTFIIW